MLAIRMQNAWAARTEREDRGAAMAEYGLLLALVALVAIGVLAAFGSKIGKVFETSDSQLQKGLDKVPTTN